MADVFQVDLSGKTVLVTGASGGLGRHFSIVLAKAGANVIAAARNQENLSETIDIILSNDGRARAVELDVTREESVAAVIDASGPIDVLINNAGVAMTGKVLDVKAEDWDSILDTNLRGAWLVASAVARQMVEDERGGSIVNIASILGERVAGGVMPYSVSKAGLIQMTKAMALELAKKGIRVNALAPGYIKTDLNREFLESEAGLRLMKRVPQRRFGEMKDLDGALLLLSSTASEFMTGSVLAIDGGHLVSSL